jgi:protein TonB
MTNKEILNADVLDILFENRNKTYGAYALRKEYNHRLGWALGGCLGFCLLLVMINYFGNKNSANSIFNNNPDVIVSVIDIPKDKPKEPEIEKPKDQPQKAEVKSNAIIRIVDNNTKTDMPTQEDVKNSLVSDETTDGDPDDRIAKATLNTNNNNGDNDQKGNAVDNSRGFEPKEVSAQYPGGKDAFAAFLSKYLVTPDELEAGEKKTVLVRFMVDVDGSISKTEIVQSGGDKFDKEVTRVLRKMPKWIPAQQNGIKVATYFTQPVTFIGIEQ